MNRLFFEKFGGHSSVLDGLWLKIKEYLIRKFFNQKIAFITYELLILN